MKIELNAKQREIIYSVIDKKTHCEEKLNLATNEMNNAIQLLIADDIKSIEKIEIVDGNIEYELIKDEVSE